MVDARVHFFFPMQAKQYPVFHLKEKKLLVSQCQNEKKSVKEWMV